MSYACQLRPCDTEFDCLAWTRRMSFTSYHTLSFWWLFRPVSLIDAHITLINDATLSSTLNHTNRSAPIWHCLYTRSGLAIRWYTDKDVASLTLWSFARVAFCRLSIPGINLFEGTPYPILILPVMGIEWSRINHLWIAVALFTIFVS